MTIQALRSICYILALELVLCAAGPVAYRHFRPPSDGKGSITALTPFCARVRPQLVAAIADALAHHAPYHGSLEEFDELCALDARTGSDEAYRYLLEEQARAHRVLAAVSGRR